MELLERGRALRHAPRPRKRVRHRDSLLLPRESAPQAARRHLVRPAQLQGGVRGDAARRRGRKRALRLRRARRELALHARWQAALWCGSSELVPLLCLCLAHRRALEPHGHHGQALPRLPSRDGGRARLQRAPRAATRDPAPAGRRDAARQPKQLSRPAHGRPRAPPAGRAAHSPAGAAAVHLRPRCAPGPKVRRGQGRAARAAIAARARMLHRDLHLQPHDRHQRGARRPGHKGRLRLLGAAKLVRLPRHRRADDRAQPRRDARLAPPARADPSPAQAAARRSGRGARGRGARARARPGLAPRLLARLGRRHRRVVNTRSQARGKPRGRRGGRPQRRQGARAFRGATASPRRAAADRPADGHVLVLLLRVRRRVRAARLAVRHAAVRLPARRAAPALEHPLRLCAEPLRLLEARRGLEAPGAPLLPPLDRSIRRRGGRADLARRLRRRAVHPPHEPRGGGVRARRASHLCRPRRLRPPLRNSLRRGGLPLRARRRRHRRAAPRREPRRARRRGRRRRAGGRDGRGVGRSEDERRGSVHRRT
mmetsp:Transcript_6425/g.21520  ORF Transcript_6425/g.21520 Transcript_6425/m.21520 type:complete len:542 (+) Transcript_6425:180-1805(+)